DASYIVCGRTDMRKQIDGLCAIIEEKLHMGKENNGLFLFCGRRHDRIKAILYEKDGIVLLYKRLSVDGRFRWPKNQAEVRRLTRSEERRVGKGRRPSRQRKRQHQER